VHQKGDRRLKKCHDLIILENINIAKDTYKMSLKADTVEFDTLTPGTFINIKIEKGGAPLLRRPISIFDADEKNKVLKIIYKNLGYGTGLMTKLVPGDVLDVLGPLGTGFPIQNASKSVLLVGGGVGVPPLYELGKRLLKEGVKVTSVLGFRDKESAFCMEDFGSIGKCYIATEDGTLGDKGFVTDAIIKHQIDFDTIYACGPKVMLKALDQAYQGKKEGYLSFEERMACGIGACYACMIDTKDGLKRVCKDGPVFKLGEVTYE